MALTDDELRNWQEIAHHLGELTRQTGWGALIEFSHERMRLTKHAVLNGNIADLDKYKNQTGWLRGIHDTLDAPKTVQQMVDDEIARRRAANPPDAA